MLTVGSLFTGIGGLDLGLERAGLVIQWQIENDPYAVAVLQRHWPNIPRYTDVRTVDARSLSPVDVMAGGFPCQPVSIAGQRRAQDDSRWLWPEFTRCISDIRPRYIVVENVTGLLRRGFGSVLRDLATMGYDAEWGVLSACAFGASHPRDRVFLVAYPTSDGWQQGWAVASTDFRIISSGPYPRWEQWGTEPYVDRMVKRLPHRVDRLRGIGNAVCPPIAEWLGRRIIEREELMSAAVTAKQGIEWATLTDSERERLNHELCSACQHTRQWHIWGDQCRKTAACQCTTFVSSGSDG